MAAAPKSQPIVELVAEEPPAAPPPKLSILQQVLVVVQETGFVGGTWYRVAVMPSQRSAAALATRLGNHDATRRMCLEWQAADSKVFVRGPQ
ncbi:MAG: hypothetical protein M3Q68_08535 [Actinomycetota bacterium]|nr:hypothetical protein [Actinomycetota bacterium]